MESGKSRSLSINYGREGIALNAKPARASKHDGLMQIGIQARSESVVVRLQEEFKFVLPLFLLKMAGSSNIAAIVIYSGFV
jgi:hypothetical protein